MEYLKDLIDKLSEKMNVKYNACYCKEFLDLHIAEEEKTEEFIKFLKEIKFKERNGNTDRSKYYYIESEELNEELYREIYQKIKEKIKEINNLPPSNIAFNQASTNDAQKTTSV